MNNSPIRYFPPPPQLRYKFIAGQNYLLWADKSEDGHLRQISKEFTGNVTNGAIRISGDTPVQGEIKDVVWNELAKDTQSTNDATLYNAFSLLGSMSGAAAYRYRGDNSKPDFPFERFMNLVIPLFQSSDDKIAFRAVISAYGVPDAREGLLKVANAHPKLTMRGAAFISLRGLKTPDVEATAHRALQTVPPEITSDEAAIVQDNALRLLADFPGERSRFAWRAYAAHPITRVRGAVAAAIGEAKEGALAWLLGKMVDDPIQKVRYAAVRSLLALPPDMATATWKKRCTHDYCGQFFINALAARDIQPYLPRLMKILLNPIRPKTGVEILGESPDLTSWQLVFSYVSTKPKPALESATFAPLLNSLENSRWLQTKVSTLYRLYRTKKLENRARVLRQRPDFVPPVHEELNRVDLELTKKAPAAPRALR
jgi:hypothetical protein